MSYGGQFILAGIVAVVAVLPMVWWCRLVIVWPLERLTGRNLLDRKWLDSRAGRWIVLAVGAFELVLFLYAWQVEPRQLDITRHEVVTEKLPAGERLRIVHLSDLHIDGQDRLPDGLAVAVNQLGPDLVLLTGDYLNNAAPDSEAGLLEFIDKLEPTHGIYGVAGNWDIRPWSKARSLLREAGVQMMDGFAMEVPGSDLPIRISGHLDGSMREAHGDYPGFDIALHHTPDSIEELAGRVDLYLCGHTHGGQVRMPFFGAVITLSKFWKRYEMGRYEVGGTTLYVNRGIGAEGGVPRIRFLAPPELAVIDVIGSGQ
jgi:uncharacterized protein